MKRRAVSNEKLIRAIIAAVLAVIVWFIINGSSTDLVEQDINSIPVTLVNVETLQDKQLVLADNRNYYVNLTVRGTDTSLHAINRQEITAEVDMSEVDSAGEQQLEVTIRGLSNSVILQEVTPSQLTLNVENVTESEMDVAVVTNGKPEGNNAVISAWTDEKVTLDGSEDSLSQVAEITATIDVDGMTSDSERYVEVVPRDRDGNVVDNVVCSPSAVNVQVAVGKTKDVRIATPATTGTPAEGYAVTQVTVEPMQITVGGDEALLEAVNSIAVDAINVDGASRSVTEEVALQMPEGISALDGLEKVRVTAGIEPVSERSFTIDKIETRGLSSDRTLVSVSDSSVVVRLSGVTSELNGVDASKIEAWIDLSGLGAGEYDVDIQVTTDTGEVVSVSPTKTTVKIE